MTSGILFFPLIYVISDIYSEIFGRDKARQLVLIGAVSLLSFSILLFLISLLPFDPEFSEGGKAFNTILALAPRISAASITSYIIGDFINIQIITTLKTIFKGRYFPIRAVFSTFISVFCESILFFYMAFYKIFPEAELWQMIIIQSQIKIIYEIILLPLSVFIIKMAKQK